MQRYSTSENNSEDLSVNIQNLIALEDRQSLLFKSRMALVRELAYTICNGGEASSDEIKEHYSSVFPSENQKRAYGGPMEYFNAISIPEKIGICREISNLSTSRNDFKSSFVDSVIGAADPCKPEAVGKIAYVKNNFTDLAYLAFSKLLDTPRCAYLDSFDAICEDVHSGECEFCILPIETSADGKLLSFYSMIDRYEFKIISTYSVEHSDGSKFTRFALLGRSIKQINSISSPGTKLELRIPESSNKEASVYKILCAADACNMRLCRIDSIPLPYNDSKLSYYAVFDMDGADTDAFITYIAIEHPQCYALGIYFEK
jgi:prephenate dehydratase